MPTLQDFRDPLKGQNKADQAIFWFGYFWHNGRDDLYRAMVATGYDPHFHLQKQISTDTELEFCRTILQNTFRPLCVEYPMQLVKLADAVEGDVLTPSRNKFICIAAGFHWPCRVVRWHGALGVHCAEDHRTRYPGHVLEADANGFVDDFRL